MRKERVCIVKGTQPYETTKRALKRLNFSVNNKKVLIKPNFVMSHPNGPGIVTNAATIRAILEFINDCKTTIGEGSASGDAIKAFKIAGVLDLKKDFDINFLDFDKDKIVKKLVPKPVQFKELPMASSVFDFDYIISASKLKVHCWAGVTMSLKNMFGCVPLRRNKVIIHLHIKKAIVDINQLVYPDFCVVDGIIGNQRDEANSDPVLSGIVIAGKDALAVDIVATRCMGINPNNIEYLRIAEKMFEPREIKVIGEKIEDVMKRYDTSMPFKTQLRYLGEKLASKVLRFKAT